MDDYIGFMFTILFTTLGPLKTIPVFHMVTHETTFPYRFHLAIRATIMATIIAYFVAFGASDTMQKLHVSVEAMTIAGGVILLVTSIRSIVGFSLADLPAAKYEEPVEPKLTWMGKPTLSPLAVPAIVTPAAVVAILTFMARSEDNPELRVGLLILIGAMLLANFVGMLLAAPIMRIIGWAPLQIVAWVFSVLQAGLAVELILVSKQLRLPT